MKYLLISEIVAIVAWTVAHFTGAMPNPFIFFAPLAAMGAGIVAAVVETLKN